MTDKITYQLKGRHMPAQLEAMKVILTHEKIPFETAVGPHASMAVIVDAEHARTVEARIQEWYEAIHGIHTAVWEVHPARPAQTKAPIGFETTEVIGTGIGRMSAIKL